MLAQVPSADVIVTNPTHYAVALRYGRDVAAPRVVAKGADLIALRIREIATEHEVAIVENAPLARSLYAQVEVGDEIPPLFFAAVAEVLAYVYRTAGRSRLARRAVTAAAA
jgi:flagellar biosynthesis protein FlhB